MPSIPNLQTTVTVHRVLTKIDADTNRQVFFPTDLAIELGVRANVWLTLNDIRNCICPVSPDQVPDPALPDILAGKGGA